MTRCAMLFLGLTLAPACIDEPTFELADITIEDGEVSAVTRLGLEVVRLTDGEPSSVLTTLPPPEGAIDEEIVASGETIYFNRSDGLYALARQGGSAVRIDGASPYDFVVLGSSLFFLDGEQLFRRDSSTRTVTAVTTPSLEGAITFTTDGKTLAWSTGTRIWVAQLGTRSARQLAEQGAFRLAIHAGSVWTSGTDILRIDLTGGAPARVANVSERASRLRFDGSHVYWSEPTTAFRSPIRGGEPEQLVFGNRMIRDIEVDGGELYFLQGGRRLGERLYEAAETELIALPLPE